MFHVLTVDKNDEKWEKAHVDKYDHEGQSYFLTILCLSRGVKGAR